MDVTNYWWVGVIDTSNFTILWGHTIMGVAYDL